MTGISSVNSSSTAALKTADPGVTERKGEDKVSTDFGIVGEKKPTEKPDANQAGNPADKSFFEGEARNMSGHTTAKLRYESSNGTPRFGKEDIPFHNQMGKDKNIERLGSGTSAVGMALSKISGVVVDPGQVHGQLTKTGGFAKNEVDWDKAAKTVGMGAQSGYMDFGKMDKELAAGRPVVVPVDFANGEKVERYITVTRGQGETYFANDPVTGQEIKLTLDKGNNQLEGKSADGKSYKTGNQLIYFTDGMKVAIPPKI